MSLRRLSVESLEQRRVLSASTGWDGPGVGAVDLTYYIGEAPGSISQPEFKAAIETALDAWSEIVEIDFTQTDRSGLDGSLDFTSRSLDGSGNILAQAYFPDDVNRSRIAGDVQFDLAENWEIGNSQGSGAFDLVSVAAHEIGHALGLDHSDAHGAILNPTISSQETFVALSEHDVEAIRELYAARVDATVDTVDLGEDVAVQPTIDGQFTTDKNTTSGDTPFSPQNFWNIWRWSFQFRIGWRHRFFGRHQTTPAMHNPEQPTDVNYDSVTSAVDALLVINALRNPSAIDTSMNYDANDDDNVSALDALLVINQLSQQESELKESSRGLQSASVDSTRSDRNSVDEKLETTLGDTGLGDSHSDRTDAHHHRSDRRFGAGVFGAVRDVDAVFDRWALDANGFLSTDEMPPRLFDGFHRVDVDTDSLVSRTELVGAIKLRQRTTFTASRGGMSQEICASIR